MSNPRKPAHLKSIAGTTRADRPDPPAIDLPLVAAIPEPPDWLPSAHAIKEWNRLAPILFRLGLLTEGGLSALAMLCALHGNLVQMWTAGVKPTGHLIAQWRSLYNDFGLTPAAQGKVKAIGETEGQPANRFGRNGKRPA